jgi:hypothetical protein
LITGVVDGLFDEVLAGFDDGVGPFFFVFFFLSDLLFQPFDVFDAAAAAAFGVSLVFTKKRNIII